MGGNGAFFTDGEKVWRASAVKVDVLSATCAGDATLAAFLSRWFADRKNVEQALRRAMATGANVAMCAGLGDFALVDELEGRVVIEQVA
jgi:fructose-1-phosphate kinase PfkB-like protein